MKKKKSAFFQNLNKFIPVRKNRPDSLKKNQRGNIVILFTFISPVIILFSGGAVDYSHCHFIRSEIIRSADAAGIAMARLAYHNPEIQRENLESYGSAFFRNHFSHHDRIQNGSSDIISFNTQEPDKIQICTDGRIRTLILGAAGIDDIEISHCSRILIPERTMYELALVLDVSESMDNTRMENLRNSINGMLDGMFGSRQVSEITKVSIVPYSTFVNPGNAAAWDNNTWGDVDALAFYHGARFFHVDENGNIDIDTPVNHYSLHDSVPDTQWEGCVESRPYPLDETDITAGMSPSQAEILSVNNIPAEYASSGSQREKRYRDAFADARSYSLTVLDLTDPDNTLWVPVFHGDGPDCTGTDSCNYNASGTTTYGTQWDGSMFHNPDNDIHKHRNRENGIDSSHYDNSLLVEDSLYTYHENDSFDHYAKHASYYRNVLNGNITDNAFKSFVHKTGVDVSSGTQASQFQEYIFRQSYPGIWNPSKSVYEHKYDIHPSFSGNPNGNSCPYHILALENDRNRIGSHLDSITTSNGTNIANGLVWGWRTLSSGDPFNEGITQTHEDSDKWQKVIILFADGENSVDSRNTHWASSLTSYGYAYEERMGNGINTAGEMKDEMDNKLLRICHRVKEEGYMIFSIIFDQENSNVETLLRYCSTEESSPFFHSPTTAEELDEAFSKITGHLVHPRIG